MSNPRLLAIVLPFIVVIASVAGAVVMVKSRAKAERKAPEVVAPLVEVMTAKAGSRQSQVQATGVVAPARQVGLSAEVSGRVVYVADSLNQGGRFEKGAVLLRLDSRDYKLAVRQEESRVEQAEVEVRLERQRAGIAAREWDLLSANKGGADAQAGASEEAGALARREPQLAVAQRNLDAAKSALERAEISLSRTVIRAPFASVVASESVEVGQIAAPGAPLVTLLGTERYHVEVSVPVEKLGLLNVPGFNAPTEDETAAAGGRSTAIVRQVLTGTTVERTGTVVGLSAQLDPQNRTAQLLVAIDDPLDPPDGALPLLAGAFVGVQLFGQSVPNVLSVPRSALVNGTSVWTVDEDSTLRRRSVQIAWADAEDVVVSDGVGDNERIVLTSLPLPIEGMDVRVAGATPPPAVEGASR